jgi:glucans biosynthesis protein C
MSISSIALGNLRAAVILIVLAFHSVLAYLGSLPAAAPAFSAPPYRWQAFPIIDSERWFGFDLFCALQDVYLMSFMFFLSGLFVWPSLVRKGSPGYLQQRLLRLGLPFVLVVYPMMPVTLYPVYLVTAADPGLAAFWEAWRALPFWPSGPPWFLWQLLVLNIAAAGVYAFAPRFGDILGRLAASGGERPGRLFAGLAIASAVAYVPLAIAFTPWEWVERGPFALQLCRPLHYAVYFFAGLGVGAYGIDKGLLAADGMLARRWARWLAAASATFLLWIGATALTFGREVVPLWLQIIADLGFVLCCASSCFCFAAIFLRFARSRSRMLDSLSRSAYDMYLIHYVFVVWLQYALLSAPLFVLAKAAIVFGVTLILSWSASTALRRVPIGTTLLGAER